MNQESRKKTGGFTLIEILVALGLFSIISLGVFMAYANILDASVSSRLTKAAIAIAEEEIEIVRNLTYGDVGIEGGFPIGVLSAQKTVMYGGVPFVVEAFVRNIDHPFDGVLGGGSEAGDPPTDMVGHWTLSDADMSGNTVLDLTANNIDGTKKGTGGSNNLPQSTAGQLEEALNFDGTDDYVDFGDVAPMNPGTNDFSISFWIKMPGGAPLNRSVLSKQKGSGNLQGWNVWIDSDTTAGGLEVNVAGATDSAWGKITTTTDLRDNQWHHVVFEKISSDRTNWKFYVDGENVAVIEGGSDLNGSSVTTNKRFMIGRREYGGGDYFKGDVDDVRFFTRALQDEEVSALYGSAFGVNDTAPADYKLVSVRVTCPTCPRFTTGKIEFTTIVAPRGLESATSNGNLFVNVFDANGLPVSGADVNIKNNVLNPTITISDETGVGGSLKLVDVPTSTIAYEITVTKDGYSSERTYATSSFSPSIPAKLHSTVAEQTITEISFSIDKLSSLVVGTSDQFCQLVEGVNFNIEGTKLVATEPNVKKHSFSTTTDASGSRALLLEWDTYSIIPADSSYYFSGFTPNSATTTINPNSNYSFNVIVDPKDSTGLLITAVDNVGTPVDSASVGLTGSSFDQTIITGERVFSQTDWSLSNYSSQDGTIDAESLPGQITLQSSGGSYATGSVAWLISNSFVFGTSTTFQSIGWSPASQPAETGSSSLRFQLASNNDNGTWNFVGPDGTDNTYYESQGETIHTSHIGDKYFRYQVFMQTEDTDFTPQLDNINFGYTTGCLPKSQAFFNGLESGDYIATVNKSGYNTATTSISVGTNQWYQLEIPLTPDN